MYLNFLILYLKVRLEIREFCSDFFSFFETNVLGLVLISSFTLESAVVACNPASPLSDFEYNTNKRPRSTKDTNIVGNLQNSFYTDYQCILFAYLPIYFLGIFGHSNIKNSLQTSVNARKLFIYKLHTILIVKSI